MPDKLLLQRAFSFIFKFLNNNKHWCEHRTTTSRTYQSTEGEAGNPQTACGCWAGAWPGWSESGSPETAWRKRWARWSARRSRRRCDTLASPSPSCAPAYRRTAARRERRSQKQEAGYSFRCCFLFCFCLLVHPSLCSLTMCVILFSFSCNFIHDNPLLMSHLLFLCPFVTSVILPACLFFYDPDPFPKP